MPIILAVDDDPLVLQIVSHQLESRDYKVITVTDGIQAIAAVEKIRPDLIVLDAMMPGKDGLTVLKELKARPDTQKIPILMLTARHGETDIVAALESGADDYLGKPFNVEELLSRIKRLLK